MTVERKTPSLSDEAMDWLILIRENPEDPAIRSAFEKWILEAPEHRREWEKTLQMWEALEHVPSLHKRTTRNAGRLAPKSPRRIRPGIVRGVVAAGAMLCLVVLTGPSLLIHFQADYHSETAQSRSVMLDDGSSVLLAPDSAIALAFSDNRRGVILLKGEAFFDVAPDRVRPFTVEGGGLLIEALGTAFDVRIGTNDTSVALATGSLKASPQASSAQDRILVPGEILTLDRATGEMKDTTIAISDIGSWREGRLYVVDQTIGSVIEQIQRYHPALISVPDRALANQKVTGIYDLNSPDQALGALVDPYGGKVLKVSDYIRLVARF